MLLRISIVSWYCGQWVIWLKVKSQRRSRHPIGCITATNQTKPSHVASLTCDSRLTSLTSLPSSVMSLSRRLQNLSTSWSRSANALSIQLRTLLMDGPSVWEQAEEKWYTHLQRECCYRTVIVQHGKIRYLSQSLVFDPRAFVDFTSTSSG